MRRASSAVSSFTLTGNRPTPSLPTCTRSIVSALEARSIAGKRAKAAFDFCHVTVEERRTRRLLLQPAPVSRRPAQRAPLAIRPLAERRLRRLQPISTSTKNALDWVDDWEDRDYLPLAVRLSVKWADGRADSWLRRTAGSGFFEHYGIREMDKTEICPMRRQKTRQPAGSPSSSCWAWSSFTHCSPA